MIGIVILVLGWVAAQIVLLVLGILIAIKGVLALIAVLKKNSKTVFEIAFPLLSIIVGPMLAFGNAHDIIIIIVGILLIMDGTVGVLLFLNDKIGTTESTKK